MLASQKVMFNDARDLSQIVHRIYQANSQDTTWPPTGYQLRCMDASDNFKQSLDMLHDTIRSSSASVCVEEALEPMKEASVQLSKAIEEEIKSRRVHLKDYDSYRRRLKTLEQKRDQAEVSKFNQL
jgi:predicted Zn-dependent peptidase